MSDDDDEMPPLVSLPGAEHLAWWVVRDEASVPWFLVVVGVEPGTWQQHGTNGLPGLARWDLYSIDGWDQEWNGEHHPFVFLGVGAQLAMETDVSGSVRRAWGTVKWDGCCDYVDRTDVDLGYAVMEHACDVHEISMFGQALAAAYSAAYQLVGGEAE